MFLADLHTHSNCSSDGNFPMSDMARSAEFRGLDAVCITDHCDIEKYDTCEFDPGCFDKARILSEYQKAQSCEVKTEILLGMELSGANHYPDFARTLSSCEELDFIIGSVHNLRNTVDFYCLEYETEKHCEALLEQYVEEHIELLQAADFDVLGHIGYPLRYMRKKGFSVDLAHCLPRLQELFKMLSHSGRGIELNTSGLRCELQSTIPALSILKLYRACGGEIITVGSDAHTLGDIGAGIDTALSLLRETGFEYYCIFRGRRPEFIKL